MDLSNFFRTKTQSDDFKNRVAKISEMAYQTNFNLEQALIEEFGLERKDRFLTLVRDNKIDTASASHIKAFMDKIQTEIAAIPLVPLTIAFEPKEQTLKALCDWFELNVKKQVIFDISVDKKMIGGANITFNGKFLDLSIKSKFDQIVTSVLAKQAAPQPAAQQQKPTENQSASHLHLGR